MKKIAMSILFMCLICGTAFAATYTVTSITDDGTGSVEGTLSWAITQSNSSTSVDDDIVFNLSSGSTVTISATMPTISDAVTIDGDDGGTNVTVQVTVPGTSTFRVFYLDASGEIITIRNMTIKGGDVTASYYGGCIYIAYNTVVNLEYVTVSDSKAIYGGGIYIDYNGTITMDNCTIKDNTAYREYAADANIGAFGGGICSQAGTVTIDNSTISGNTAYALNTAGTSNTYTYGGGLYLSSGIKGTSTITNSTIFGNTASSSYEGGSEYAYGGGVFVESDVSIVNCTISGNEVSAADGAVGAGICNASSLTMVNTILADNTDNATHYDYYRYGSLTDNGYNVVEYSNVAANATGGFDNATDILYNTKYNESGTSFTSWTQGGTEFAKQTLYLSSTLALNNNLNGTYTLTYTNGSSIGIDDGTGTDPDQRGAAVYNSVKDIGAYEWWGSPGTKPVTLSTFTADFINNTPTLYWETQSEVDNLGWNIYRNAEEEFSSSLLLTEEMISGSGTTTEPSYYHFEDVDDLEIGQTYYYWLESIDYSGVSQVYNRIAQITIPDPSTNPPQIEPPIVYDCKNAPNPVNGSTSFSFTLDKSSMVSVSIYNIRGALLQTLPSVMTQPDETSQIYWNGKDSKGNDLSPGVYFYNLIVDGKTQETKKLILMK